MNACCKKIRAIYFYMIVKVNVFLVFIQFRFSSSEAITVNTWLYKLLGCFLYTYVYRNTTNISI